MAARTRGEPQKVYAQVPCTACEADWERSCEAGLAYRPDCGACGGTGAMWDWVEPSAARREPMLYGG